MTRSKPLIADALVSLAMCMLGWVTMFGWTWLPYFVYDDSYITLANAISWRTGVTPFSSPALTGSTSIAHTLLVSLLSVFAAPETALALSNSVALFAAVMGMAQICRHHGLSSFHTAAMSTAYACSGLTLMHAHNGLETSLVFAGSVWAIYFTTTKNQTGSAAIAGALPWIRPELAFLSLYCLYATRENFTPRGVIRWLFISLAITLPFLLITYANTHSFVPQTMAGKLAWFSEDCANTDWKIATTRSTITAYIKNIGLIFIGLAGLIISKSLKSYFLVASILVFYICYYALFPGALGHYNLRYQYFSYTLLFYGLVILTNRATKPKKLTNFLIALLAAQIATTDIPLNLKTNQKNKTFTEQAIAPVSDWVNKNTLPEATILIHDAGYIGYTSRRKLIDLVGLKTPAAVKINQQINHKSCGLNRWESISKIAETYSPQYVVTLDTWDGIFHITTALRLSGEKLEKVFSTQNGYSIYKIHKNKNQSNI